MVVKGVIVIFTFLTCCADTIAKELYSVSPVGIMCQVLDPTIVANFTCRSKNVNRTTTIAFKEIIYQPGVSLTNVGVKIQAYRKFGTVYRPFLITLDQDWCGVLGNESSAIYKALNIDDHRKFGNLYDPCPISGRRYEKRYMEYERLPDILPDGEYRLEVITYVIKKGKKRDIFRLVLMAVITPKKSGTMEKIKKLVVKVNLIV